MGRLLDKLLHGSPAYRVTREADGYLFDAEPDSVTEFSNLVREVTADGSEEFVVFTTSDGGNLYSRMFVVPLAEEPSRY